MTQQDIGSDEILIGDSIYDVAEFKKYHPGGSVIKFYVGQNGTEAWTEFHARSAKAKKMLQNMKKRPATVPQDPLVADFMELRDQLEKVRSAFLRVLIFVTLRRATSNLLTFMCFYAFSNSLCFTSLVTTFTSTVIHSLGLPFSALERGVLVGSCTKQGIRV